MLNTSIRLWNESSGKITVQESYHMGKGGWKVSLLFELR